MSPHQNMIYIAVAACLLLALHMVKRVLVPMGALLRVAAAVAVIMIALLAALALVVIAMAAGI
ncbi:hypothetical protein [Actinoplanes sp. NPDC023714]|uniref:hypothetical protein n=1 Tax=Actinoplanes sp. NPDC023714 TaxID=3154322 RepID=UPI0033C6A9AD